MSSHGLEPSPDHPMSPSHLSLCKYIVLCQSQGFMVYRHHLPANDSVFHVKMRLFGVNYEELGAISIRPTVCHGNHSTTSMLHCYTS